MKLEGNLQGQIFDGDLFLDLVRAVLGHKNNKRYSDEDLAQGKKKALKLLYRLLFILYAESRKLLPVKNQKYMQVSLGSVRERLAALEKDPESQSCWKALRRLFRAIIVLALEVFSKRHVDILASYYSKFCGGLPH